MTDCWCRRLHGSAAHFHFDENTGHYENAHCDQAGPLVKTETSDAKKPPSDAPEAATAPQR